MKGRLQFKHDSRVYNTFEQIENALAAIASATGDTEVMLLGEPYVFHYMGDDNSLRTVLAIADVNENNSIKKYSLLDIERIKEFVSKDKEILDNISDIEDWISEVGVNDAYLEMSSGETKLVLVHPNNEEIVVPLTDFRNDISDEISEAAEEALQNAKDYTDSEISALTQSVDEKLAELESADNALTDIILAESSARTAADNELMDALSAETAAREAADNEIYDAISAETAAREDAIADQAEKIESLSGRVGTLEERMSVAESGITVLGDTKVDKEAGKGLSTNDYTNEEKSKLAGIEEGAQANIIETVKVNGVKLEPDVMKAVNIEVPFESVNSADTMLTLSNGVLSSRLRIIHDSINKEIRFYGKDDNTLIATIHTDDFVKDGMLNSARVVTIDGINYLELTFNTDSGKGEPVLVNLSDIVTVYTVASDSRSYLDINNFEISVITGRTGLATGDQLHTLEDNLAWSAHTLEDEIENVQRQIGTGFTDVNVTAKVKELETKIDGAIDSLTGLSTEGVIRDNFTDIDGNRIARSGVTTVTEAVGNIVNVLNTKAKENLTSNIISGNTTISGLTTAATITEAIQTLVNIIGDNGSGKIEEDITISGETIVSGGTPVSGAIKTILERLVGDENAISDLDERLQAIEEQGSVIRNLVGDEDIQISEPDESGITHVSLLGISNPEVTELDMERTVIIRF